MRGFFFITAYAISPMDADNAAAFGTAPPRLFVFDELTDSIRFYVCEVFYHAHSVFCSVSFVQRLQSRAGIIPAFEAEFPVVFVQCVTVLDCAICCACGFAFIAFSASGAILFVSEVSFAYTAVHPAWGN